MDLASRSLDLTLLLVLLAAAAVLLPRWVAGRRADAATVGEAARLLARGEQLRQRQDFCAALEAYAQAQRLAPGVRGVELARARLLLDVGNAGQALRAANRHLRMAPRDPLGHTVRARALRRLGRHREAARDLTRVLALARSPLPEAFIAGVRALGAAQQDAAAVLAGLDETLDAVGAAAAVA